MMKRCYYCNYILDENNGPYHQRCWRYAASLCEKRNSELLEMEEKYCRLGNVIRKVIDTRNDSVLAGMGGADTYYDSGYLDSEVEK